MCIRDDLLARQPHCQLCGSGVELTIHHQLGHNRVPKTHPKRNKLEYLTVLCRNCHEMYNWAVANYGRRKLGTFVSMDIIDEDGWF